MNLRRSFLMAVLVVASLVLGPAPQGVASDDAPPPRVVPYNICEFIPWWPGCI